MKTVFSKLDHLLKPFKSWVKDLFEKPDDNDPYRNDPYIIL